MAKMDWNKLHKVLIFKEDKQLVTGANILTSIWSLQMVSITWFYFAILFIFFEIRDRWTQFSIDDVGDPEDGLISSPLGNVSNKTKGTKDPIKRWYTIRLRSNPLDPKYVDQTASIHVKFFHLKEKSGQLILPICSLRKHCQIYTNPKGFKYAVILIHWHTAANLSNIDEIRVAHSGNPGAPEIFLRDIDVREAELKIRIHCPIQKAIKAFPFVPGSMISLTPKQLDPDGPDDFRSPFERLTLSEIIIFMFVQSNLTQAMVLWVPYISPSTHINVGTAFGLAIIIYPITTAFTVVAIAYYQMMKMMLTPLKKTNLKFFRKLFILISCFVSSMFLIIVSLLATRYEDFPLNFWIVFAITGHSLQALIAYFVYSWYTSRFSLELTGKEKTAVFLWFRFRTIDHENNI